MVFSCASVFAFKTADERYSTSRWMLLMMLKLAESTVGDWAMKREQH